MSLSKQNFHYNEYISSITNFCKKNLKTKKKKIFLTFTPQKILNILNLCRKIKKKINEIKFYEKI